MSRLVPAVVACCLALMTLGCRRPPSADAGGASAGGAGAGGDGGAVAVPWPAEFAPYPGARRLCSGRAPAGALRVRWTTYASVDEPAAVTSFYARAHRVDPGRRPFVVRGRGTTTLAVHAAAATDYPQCPAGPAAGARAVILVTTAVARFAAGGGRHGTSSTPPRP